MRGRDLHRYLRFLEELLIRIAGDFQVKASRVSGRTGVWTARGKLASIGVGVRRWITMHGFALNVSTDLERFSAINPCGIAACPVTSLEDLCGISVPMEEVKEAVRRHFDPLLRQWLPVDRKSSV
jgi:lipoyl(octanoyl) transferase